MKYVIKEDKSSAPKYLRLTSLVGSIEYVFDLAKATEFTSLSEAIGIIVDNAKDHPVSTIPLTVVGKQLVTTPTYTEIIL